MNETSSMAIAGVAVVFTVLGALLWDWIKTEFLSPPPKKADAQPSGDRPSYWHMVGFVVAEESYAGGCNCAFKAPTPPTCRDQMDHLADCPAKGSGYPVGATRAGP